MEAVNRYNQTAPYGRISEVDLDRALVTVQTASGPVRVNLTIAYQLPEPTLWRTAVAFYQQELAQRLGTRGIYLDYSFFGTEQSLSVMVANDARVTCTSTDESNCLLINFAD